MNNKMINYLFIVAVFFVFIGNALAAGNTPPEVQQSMQNVGKLLFAIAYICSFALLVSAIVRFVKYCINSKVKNLRFAIVYFVISTTIVVLLK